MADTLELAVVAAVAFKLFAADVPDVLAEAVEKFAVVGDDDLRGGVAFQEVLQPDDGI